MWRIFQGVIHSEKDYIMFYILVRGGWQRPTSKSGGRGGHHRLTGELSRERGEEGEGDEEKGWRSVRSRRARRSTLAPRPAAARRDQDGLESISVDLNVSACQLDCPSFLSDCRTPDGSFYAHVQEVLANHRMSGLTDPVDVLRGFERFPIDGSIDAIDFPGSGVFSWQHLQPAWLYQTHRGLPERRNPTPAS